MCFLKDRLYCIQCTIVRLKLEMETHSFTHLRSLKHDRHI